MRAASVAALLILCCAVAPAGACTLADQLDERADRLVVVGEIAEIFDRKYEDQMIYGLIVRPLLVFQNPRDHLPEALTVFPGRGMGADCSRSYFTSTAEHYATLIETYPRGRLVAVFGYYRRSHGPGDETTVSGIQVLPEDCSLQHVVNLRPTYDRRQTACGSSEFHAYKELTGLTAATSIERREFLTRLSSFEMFMDFASLVRKYIGDAGVAGELVNMRYADVIAHGCDDRPPAEYEMDTFDRDQIVALRSFRRRWFEFCRD